MWCASAAVSLVHVRPSRAARAILSKLAQSRGCAVVAMKRHAKAAREAVQQSHALEAGAHADRPTGRPTGAAAARRAELRSARARTRRGERDWAGRVSAA